MSDLIHNTANQLAVLVEFRWGASNVRRYCRWTSDLVAGVDTYTALPEMDVKYGDQHGGTEDVPTELEILKSVEPVVWMVGKRFAPTRVTIWECDPLDVDGTLRARWRGVVDDVQGNFSETSDAVRIVVVGVKAKLDADLSLPVVAECQFRYGDPLTCKKDLAPLIQTGTITVISGTNLTITGLTDPGEPYWLRGWVEFDTYRIGIRAHVHGTNVYSLFRTPPAFWVGQVVSVTPGCTKDVAACRRNANEANFGGSGIRMPDYHPQLGPGPTPSP